MRYTIQEEKTVFQALKKLFPDSSRRTLQIWLKKGRFSLDGKPVSQEVQPVEKGQILLSQTSFKAPKIPEFSILYEDRFLIVIDKPVGLLSVPLDDGYHARKSALSILRDFYQTDQIFAVHRIDRETSGTLLFARGKQSEEKLKALFEKHDIFREYNAIVLGNIKENEGTWQSTLKELESLDVVEALEGKEAITHFSVTRRSKKYTYLKLRLETGRKHQIRVHCSSKGHPVVGDLRYGATENPLKRLCLHASSLGFIHPFTSKSMLFSSPLPKSFQVLGAS